MTNKGGRGHSAVLEAGLEDIITKEMLEGLGTRTIAKRHGLSRSAVRSFAEKLRSRPPSETLPATQDLKHAARTPPTKPVKARPGRNQELVALTADLARLKLGALLGECETNYLQAKETGDDVKAGFWAREWGAAIDKLLKATGVYSKALEQSVPEPVEITIVTECPKCKAQEIVNITQQSACKS